jgi:hypothetical protein
MKPAELRSQGLHEEIQEQYEDLLATSTKAAAKALIVKYSHQPGKNATYKWRWFDAYHQVCNRRH